jgi:hypothetical protein
VTKSDAADVQDQDIKAFDEPENKGRFDADSSWKDLIDRFFYPLLKRAIPELYAEADLRTKQRSLDKEFTDVLNTPYPDIHTSPHFADFLMEVPLKSGEAESQGRQGLGEPRRQFPRARVRALLLAVSTVPAFHKTQASAVPTAYCADFHFVRNKLRRCFAKVHGITDNAAGDYRRVTYRFIAMDPNCISVACLWIRPVMRHDTCL